MRPKTALGVDGWLTRSAGFTGGPMVSVDPRRHPKTATPVIVLLRAAGILAGGEFRFAFEDAGLPPAGSPRLI